MLCLWQTHCWMKPSAKKITRRYPCNRGTQNRLISQSFSWVSWKATKEKGQRLLCLAHESEILGLASRNLEAKIVLSRPRGSWLWSRVKGSWPRPQGPAFVVEADATTIIIMTLSHSLFNLCVVFSALVCVCDCVYLVSAHERIKFIIKLFYWQIVY